MLPILSHGRPKRGAWCGSTFYGSWLSTPVFVRPDGSTEREFLMERRTFLALVPGCPRRAGQQHRPHATHPRSSCRVRAAAVATCLFSIDPMSSWQILIRLQAGECQ
jgi:hypothetical protein